jgi:hypothetical protein
MNVELFFFLFNNFIGGADDDDLDHYVDLDLNDVKSRNEFLKCEIKPFFDNNFTNSQKKELATLLTNLQNGDIKLDMNDVDNQLFPFEMPENLFVFYKSIEEVMYQNR